MDIVISKNGVPIRLTEERWEHVTKSHDYMAPYYKEGDYMAKVLTKELSKEVQKIVPLVLEFKQEHLFFDYDKEADVLYISFQHPQQATDSELLPSDMIVNYRKGEIVGITILNAKKKCKLSKTK